MSFSKSQLMNFDPNIENQNILHINRLDPRATIIPAQKRGVYYRNKEESSFLRSLNGDYRFLYKEEDTEKSFYKVEIDDSSWDIIDVPSMWQYRGYGKPEYPNVKYSIPATPPFVKKQNPVGCYRKSFFVSNPAEKSILHFGGVDNAFYVYLNGELVGFSKGSRLPSEFDVTSLIKEGENLLAVKVFTYSDATYLENQDMLLASGIFRDVYLIESAADTLWDYRVTSTYTSISVELKPTVSSDYDIRIELDGQTAIYAAKERIYHTFELKDPKLWSAETPNLYDLSIELIKNGEIFETHSKRVGILHSRVEGNKFLVNEHPIYIKGINRHENNAKNGKAITVEQIEADLKMIKANNLNAIRLSHYTNNPATYEIASEIGLYLMDEADLETHGAYVINGDQGFLSQSPEWYDAYYDRVYRMLETNKNEACIFMYSTGNECGRGKNLSRLFKVIREFDPTKECVSAQDTGENSNFRGIAYYPMIDAEVLSEEGGPVFAIEYAHAMGNSPGCLEDYWDYNYTHPQMAGGFVWEFRSHGFYCEDEEEKVFYKYGGDFDDIYHWCNFTLDGFCMSDGTPKPSWYELRHVLFAAYTTFDGKRLTVKNTNDFISLSYLTAYYEITEDGVSVKKVPFEIPDIKPHESFCVDVDLSLHKIIAGARYCLNVYYLEDGKQVHQKQFALGALEEAKRFIPRAFERAVSVENYVLKIKGSNFSVEFTKGMLSRLEYDGKLLLDAPMKLNFWRAHTDNDGIKGLYEKHYKKWKKALLDRYYFNLYDIDVAENDDRITVTTIGKMTADSVYAGFICKITYEVYSGGNVLVSINGEPYGELPDTLPRIGVIFCTDKTFETCEWLGRGIRENYCDEKAASPFGRYLLRVEDMNVLYDYPQETGNHEKTVLVSLKSSDRKGFSIVGSNEFSFSYHDFALDDLENATHKNELHKSTDFNYLYVDYKNRGLGSESCGPPPEEKYELHPHSFEFSFVITPNGYDNALGLSRKAFEKTTRALSGTYVQEPIQRVSQIADCIKE